MFLLWVLAFVGVHVCADVIEICPDNPLIFIFNPLFDSGHISDSHSFILTELQPSASYEAKLSYIGTEPFGFHFEWENQQTPLTSGYSRRLLDVEKILFQTDSEGRVIIDGKSGHPNTRLKLTAIFNGIVSEPQRAFQPFKVHLVIETLIFGVLPSVVPRLIAFLLMVLFIAIFAWPHFVKLLTRLFPELFEQSKQV